MLNTEELVSGACGVGYGAGTFSNKDADVERKPNKTGWLHQSRRGVDQQMCDVVEPSPEVSRATSGSKDDWVMQESLLEQKSSKNSCIITQLGNL